MFTAYHPCGDKKTPRRSRGVLAAEKFGSRCTGITQIYERSKFAEGTKKKKNLTFEEKNLHTCIHKAQAS